MAGSHPLIICDVDEVVLHFVAPFETFLEGRGLRLVKRSYALTGNIVEAASGRALGPEETGRLVLTFFEIGCASQPVIEGSAEALAELSEHAEIRFLTNIPSALRELRCATLAGHGMPYPVHANSGPKGRVAAELAAGRTGEVVFLDDIGPNLVSVREALPRSTLIHFINDPAFFELAPKVEGIHHKTGDWRDAKSYILSLLGRTAN